MSEQATLLKSIPPVSKGKDTKATSSSPKLSLLSQDKESSQPKTSSQPKADNVIVKGQTESTIKESGDAVASEASLAQDEETSISLFQAVVYGSFVLNFVLAGFVAVMLFRKSSKILVPRYTIALWGLGGICIATALHGLLATFFYNNFLWGEGSLPLVFSVALWVLVGPSLAVVLSHLLTRFDKPNRLNMGINMGCYAGIFLLAMFAVSNSLTANGALILGLISLFLFIIPVARYMQNFTTAKARHKELKGIAATVCTNSLLFGPALIPVLVLCKVFGLSPELVQFLYNLLFIDIILFGSFGMLMLVQPEETSAEAVEGEEPEAQNKTEVAAQEEAPSAMPPKTSKQSKKKKSSPDKAAPRVTDDPIIQFLNENPDENFEPDEGNQPTPPPKPSRLPAASYGPKPPDKPSSSASGLPKKPQKPGDSGSAKNAPEDIKAPPKPKKRI